MDNNPSFSKTQPTFLQDFQPDDYSNTNYFQNRRNRSPFNNPDNNNYPNSDLPNPNNESLPNFLKDSTTNIDYSPPIDPYPLPNNNKPEPTPNKRQDTPSLIDKIALLSQTLETEKQKTHQMQLTYENDLSQKNKTIETYQRSEKLKDETISKQAQFYENEISKRIKLEQERLELIHKTDIDILIQKYETQLQEQKTTFESQKQILDKQIQQQIKLNALALQVQQSSNQIHSIVSKLTKTSNENEKNEFHNKNNFITIEAKLRSFEVELNKEKEELKLKRENLENEHNDKTKAHYEELSRIKNELLQLEKLQNKFEIEKNKLKEHNELHRIEINREYERYKIDLDNDKLIYKSKLNELDSQKRLFEEEKNHFMNYKNEMMLLIETKKKELDEQKELFIQEEDDIKQRIQSLIDKECIITQKYNDFDTVRSEIDIDKDEISKQKETMETHAKQLEEDVNEFNAQRSAFDVEVTEFIKNKNQLQNDKIQLNNDLLLLKQQQNEFELKAQSFELAKAKYNNIITDFNFNSNTNTISNSNTKSINVAKSLMDGYNNNFYSYSISKENTIQNQNGASNSNYDKTYNNTFKLRSKYTQQQQLTKEKFNADEYYKQLEKKLNHKRILEDNVDNGMFRGDINANETSARKSERFSEMLFKEKEFVRKSRASLENSIQMDKIQKSIPKPTHKGMFGSGSNFVNNNNDVTKIIQNKEMDESKVDTVNFYNKHSATIIMNDVKKENEINE